MDRDRMSFNEKFWLFWLLSIMVLGLLTSCKTKYVSVPEYHTVYVEKHDTLVTRDSIFEKDSIYVIKSGDTITTYHERILYKDRWRDKIVYRDSIRVDSIRVPYPVKEAPSIRQKFRLGVSGFLLGSFICAMLLVIKKLFFRKT